MDRGRGKEEASPCDRCRWAGRPSNSVPRPTPEKNRSRDRPAASVARDSTDPCSTPRTRPPPARGRPSMLAGRFRNHSSGLPDPRPRPPELLVGDQDSSFRFPSACRSRQPHALKLTGATASTDASSRAPGPGLSVSHRSGCKPGTSSRLHAEQDEHAQQDQPGCVGQDRCLHQAAPGSPLERQAGEGPDKCGAHVQDPDRRHSDRGVCPTSPARGLPQPAGAVDQGQGQNDTVVIPMVKEKQRKETDQARGGRSRPVVQDHEVGSPRPDRQQSEHLGVPDPVTIAHPQPVKQVVEADDALVSRSLVGVVIDLARGRQLPCSLRQRRQATGQVGDSSGQRKSPAPGPATQPSSGGPAGGETGPGRGSSSRT